MGKEYNEIIEIEYFDLLATNGKNELLVSILLFTAEKLNSEFNSLYEFEVVNYGFQGIYPVIGVIYKNVNLPEVEDVVLQKFDEILKSNNLKDFYDFIILKCNEIHTIVTKLKSDNDENFDWWEKYRNNM
jgi:hypothetical protein